MHTPKKEIWIHKSEYWSCGVEEHHHLTERVATNCAKKQAFVVPKLDAQKYVRAQRDRNIMEQYLMTPNFRAIAREYGMSSQRTRDIVHKFYRLTWKPKLVPKHLHLRKNAAKILWTEELAERIKVTKGYQKFYVEAEEWRRRSDHYNKTGKWT